MSSKKDAEPGATATELTQAEIVEALTRRTVDVPTPVGTLTLHAPDAEGLAEIRKVAFQSAQVPEKDREQRLVMGFSLAMMVVLCTCPHLHSMDDAARLIVATGGEMGELTQAAFSLCGMDKAVEAAIAKAGMIDDPT